MLFTRLLSLLCCFLWHGLLSVKIEKNNLCRTRAWSQILWNIRLCLRGPIPPRWGLIGSARTGSGRSFLAMACGA
jgi:hypothetical protein